MKDYKLLNDAQIANIVYKIVHQISPKCCSNYAGLNKQEKELCINKLMKKMNINQDQASYLLNPSNWNYREALLIMDGRKEELIFSNAILFCRKSKGKLVFINIFLSILFLPILIGGINGLIQNSNLSALLFISPILLLPIIYFNIIYRYAYFSYEKLKNDPLITQKLSIKNIKLVLDLPIGDKLRHTSDILGFKLFCIDEKGKKIRLIYPLKFSYSYSSYLKIRKQFNSSKHRFLKEGEITYSKGTSFIIKSFISFDKLLKN